MVCVYFSCGMYTTINFLHPKRLNLMFTNIAAIVRNYEKQRYILQIWLMIIIKTRRNMLTTFVQMKILVKII